jgi:hypothetical protein
MGLLYLTYIIEYWSCDSYGTAVKCFHCYIPGDWERTECFPCERKLSRGKFEDSRFKCDRLTFSNFSSVDM